MSGETLSPTVSGPEERASMLPLSSVLLLPPFCNWVPITTLSHPNLLWPPSCSNCLSPAPDLGAGDPGYEPSFLLSVSLPLRLAEPNCSSCHTLTAFPLQRWPSHPISLGTRLGKEAPDKMAYPIPARCVVFLG